ncbi:hypothetical protein CCUS01_06535 [Colletotrichum cuscutae]|uniref:Uncharacterized protein n=1 Tax=Colletotrichum cuscutae TaxID=1209917 RepID=A0AAI9Y0P7_9PEZI|nr:hypothetical protein CCUS01_06535 [Colletotrichum cuscutae]
MSRVSCQILNGWDRDRESWWTGHTIDYMAARVREAIRSVEQEDQAMDGVSSDTLSVGNTSGDSPSNDPSRGDATLSALNSLVCYLRGHGAECWRRTARCIYCQTFNLSVCWTKDRDDKGHGIHAVHLTSKNFLVSQQASLEKGSLSSSLNFDLLFHYWLANGQQTTPNTNNTMAEVNPNQPTTEILFKDIVVRRLATDPQTFKDFFFDRCITTKGQEKLHAEEIMGAVAGPVDDD